MHSFALADQPPGKEVPLSPRQLNLKKMQFCIQDDSFFHDDPFLSPVTSSQIVEPNSYGYEEESSSFQLKKQITRWVIHGFS